VDVLRGWKIDESRLHVMRNGVDLQRFTPLPRAATRAALGLGEGPVLLSVGHLIERKGHHLAIEALASVRQRHPSARLVIVGAGEERAHLAALAARLGLTDAVTLAGAIPNEELARWYSAADLLILASSREGWANVLLEAMACGTPVVATRLWGTPEVLTDPVAGVLVERTVPSLADGVLQVLSRLPDPAAVRRYAEGFDWAATSKAQQSLFERLAQKAAHA